MAAQGAALQTQNNELVKCIEELREKRDLLNRSIREEEAEKAKIKQDLEVRQLHNCWQIFVCQRAMVAMPCAVPVALVTRRGGHCYSRPG